MRHTGFVARYHADQVRHRRRLPPLPPVGHHILAELRRDGVAAVPLEELPLRSNAALLAAMPRVCQHLDGSGAAPDRGSLEYEHGFDHCVPINPSVIATDYPEFFMWGLDDTLLDIIENYIGVEVAYHGVCIRKEIVDGRSAGTRLWHTDFDDLNVVRVMIYLNDVLDDDSGPFEYVPRHSSPTYRDFRGVEVITDEEMKRVVPEWRWRRAKGPRGTVLFGAVAKIFHHGKIPLNARKMASFHYTSRHPSHEVLCRAFSFEPGIPYLCEPLTERQRACLWKYQELLPSPQARRAPKETDIARPEDEEAPAAPRPAPRVPTMEEPGAPASLSLAGWETT